MKKIRYNAMTCLPEIDEKALEWIENLENQRVNKDKNKKYICDPFVGLIEKKEA